MTSNKAVVFCVLLLPCLTLCGKIPLSVSDETPDSRIVNGHTAAPGQFPYQVSLRYQNRHFCGGAIIHPEWIVTAYHCVTGRTPVMVTAVVGANHLLYDGTNVTVIEIIHHPEAIADESDPTNIRIENDISLLRVTTLTYGPTISGISVGAAFIGAGVPVTISGWGNYAWPNVILPEDLQFMEQVSLTNIDCRSRHVYLSHAINDGHLCAFSFRGQGLCHGDSGGPLVANGQLVGLASFVEPCARGRPDAYTRVSTHAEWITETIGSI